MGVLSYPHHLNPSPGNGAYRTPLAVLTLRWRGFSLLREVEARPGAQTRAGFAIKDTMTDEDDDRDEEIHELNVLLAAILLAHGGKLAVKKEHLDAAQAGIKTMHADFVDENTVVISITETAGH